MIEAQFPPEGKHRMQKMIPDFARQRRELLQSIQLTLIERVAGKTVEEQLGRMFRETAAWLRLPAGVAAAGGIVTVIVAMSSAAVADVTGVLAASAAVIGTIVAFTQRRRILAAYAEEMETRRRELTQAIEQQMEHAIDLFYKEITVAFDPLIAFCTTERQRYEPLRSRAEKLMGTVDNLAARIGGGQ
jgi:acyl-CoA reductase-like NAD-dependent aldehyde dehydrogenase